MAQDGLDGVLEAESERFQKRRKQRELETLAGERIPLSFDAQVSGAWEVRDE